MVIELFSGHKTLILGFNQFLPHAYRIDPEDIPDDPPREPDFEGFANANSANQALKPEFNHARNYVKKIKQRFANDPRIYKNFLEILHTYHHEQLSIRQVDVQVASLFEDHPDLLQEFRQFLPDPSLLPPSSDTMAQVTRAKKQREIPPVIRKEPKKRSKQQPPKRQTYQEDIIDEAFITTASQNEIRFFQKLKSRMNNQHLYYEFLKCLDLFSQGILTRFELLVLAKDLIGKFYDLYEEFKQFIGFDNSILEAYERTKEDFSLKPQLQITSSYADIDFKSCKRYGPSYRGLPKNYIPPICSGRTELCNQVLNDIWISFPTGSEDYGFKNLRKNQYEEMLFKCEDDRFELDLVVEWNRSAIRLLEDIQTQIEQMSPEQRLVYRLDAPLDVVHIRNIERIFGQHALQVISALYNSPSASIQVVLKRFVEKDIEWSNARNEWNKVWKQVNETNYYKSLDYQSNQFKQTDKKALSSKSLVAEIKQKHQECLKNAKESNSATASKGPHLIFDTSDPAIFNDIAKLINYCSERILHPSDREKVLLSFLILSISRTFFNS